MQASLGQDLDSCSWAAISRISRAGLASQYFSVGDCKSVHVQGTVGKMEINATYYVYILGFDHNSEVEGSGITFGCFKNARENGLDIALIDSNYNDASTDGTKYFSMNHTSATSSNGWKNAALRYDILGSVHQKNATNANETVTTEPVANTLMAALPEELRMVIKPITKYTDNYSQKNTDPDKVTATIDYLPLLAEYEITGARASAHPNELDHQMQYQYFAVGNSKKKYKPDGSDAVYYWTRSPHNTWSTQFCRINSNGESGGSLATNSWGISPIFLV